MKNLILKCAIICMLIFAGVNQCLAQQTKLRFGIKAGLDVTTLGSYTDYLNAPPNNTLENYQYLPGFQGGIFAMIPLSDKVDFMPQVSLAQKGGYAIKEVYVESDALSQLRVVP